MWFQQRGVDLALCEESNFDEKPVPTAQLYPLPGGMIKTAGLEDDSLNINLLKVDGIENLHPLFKTIPGEASYTLIDPALLQTRVHQRPRDSYRKKPF